MQTSVSLPQNELFTSWKEIASYLNKGVRTVQRWEAEFGLPVRRPREKARGVVQASRMELDRWINSTWAQRGRRATRGNMEELQKNHALRLENQALMVELSVSLQRLQSECIMLRQQVECSKHARAAAATGTEGRLNLPHH